MELFLLLDVLLLQILLSPPLSTFSSPLGNCNCATFNLEQYNQLRLHGNLSREPFTNRSDMVCCNSQQLSSLASLDAEELTQLTHFTEEVRLRRVASPMLILGQVPVLHLSHYWASQDDHLQPPPPPQSSSPQTSPSSSSSSAAETPPFPCRMRHFYLRDSDVNVDLLDTIAVHCHLLTVFHLERVRPTLVPDPAPDNTENGGENQQQQSPPMHREFNVLTKHFTSPHLAVVSLIGCQIISLAGFDLLANATQLRVVSLSRNQLTSLEEQSGGRAFFPLGSGLWSIDLSYNKLRSIPMDWPFPGSLRVLRLDHNQFKVLQFDPFRAVWFGLSEFWIGANIFDCKMMAQSEEWMQVLMAAVRAREEEEEDRELGTLKNDDDDNHDLSVDRHLHQRVPIGLDGWTCYHHNGTRRLSVLQLPLLVLNNQTERIFGGSADGH